MTDTSQNFTRILLLILKDPQKIKEGVKLYKKKKIIDKVEKEFEIERATISLNGN